MKESINPVLQDWVMSLGWKEQTGLISAIRGVDSSDDDKGVVRNCKKITKMIRYLVLNNADSKTGFMSDRVIEIHDLVDILNTLNDKVIQGQVSFHWFDHIFIAIKIIIDKHPNPYTRVYWSSVYNLFVSSVTMVEQETKKKSTTDTTIGESLTSEPEDTIDSVLSEYGLSKVYIGATIYPTLNGEEPVVTDTKVPTPEIIGSSEIGYPCEYSEMILNKTIKDRKPIYTLLDYDNSYDKLPSNFISRLAELDSILTCNYDILNDTMSAGYNCLMDLHNLTKIEFHSIDTTLEALKTADGLFIILDNFKILYVSTNGDLRVLKLIYKESTYTKLVVSITTLDTSFIDSNAMCIITKV